MVYRLGAITFSYRRARRAGHSDPATRKPSPYPETLTITAINRVHLLRLPELRFNDIWSP